MLFIYRLDSSSHSSLPGRRFGLDDGIELARSAHGTRTRPILFWNFREMFCNFHDVALHDDDSFGWSTSELSSRAPLNAVLNHVSGFYGDIQSPLVALAEYGEEPIV